MLHLIAEIRDKMNNLDDELVYTMVSMNVSPNIYSIMPNKVVFSFEARYKDAKTISQVEKITQGPSKSSGKEQCEVKITKQWDHKTVWFNEKLVNSDSIRKVDRANCSAPSV
ncbi:hypothetical protein KFZ58_12095 [Virgibacillus sp. NKC19-16]|uniref:hypothetical protein n=1 Tax=Virgibacillus salidurans TaxID=2831673 RepID=UPI001F3810E6|nr:hypothetical protein [Virgibacillus sp. NKC19-16]UJL45154.1 hypothetical protein KFZ58_12095 [Virgibacillus sp. NKC19-16]